MQRLLRPVLKKNKFKQYHSQLSTLNNDKVFYQTNNLSQFYKPINTYSYSSQNQQFQKASDKTFRQKYGGGQGEKYITLKGNPYLKDSNESKINLIAKEGIVRKPRSFKDDRQNQNLRHLASAIKIYLDNNKVKGYQEVQVGMKDGTYYVSTNSNKANDFLRNKLIKEETSLKDVANFSEIKSEVPKKLKMSGRLERHRNKFIKRQGDNSTIKLKVVKNEEVKFDGLHAELRIKKEMGIVGKLSKDIYIKGIKRPCAHCYPKMLKENQIESQGPGPEWGSKAARIYNTQPSKEITHLTLSIDNKKITYGHDTDSDTDSD